MKYYIYRHIRLDTETPFYVGKGTGNRAWESFPSRRNTYWCNIVRKCGHRVEIILDNLTETQAFSKEIEFIKYYKELDYCEANLSVGGEGCSLFGKHNPMYGKKHSNKRKEKMRARMKGENNPFYGKHHTEETKQRLRQKNMGFKHTEETKKKISLSQMGEKHWAFGKTFSEAYRKKLSDAHKGKILSENTRQKMSLSRSGKKHPKWKGYVISPQGIFETASEASKILGIAHVTVSNRCSSVKFPEWYFDKSYKEIK